MNRIVFVPAAALASVLLFGGAQPAAAQQILCTRGAVKACFGFTISFVNYGNDSTRIWIQVQDLQGTIPQDNTAWSQLLYIAVTRNSNPSLKFPPWGEAVLPTWSGAVGILGSSPPGSGWTNRGTSEPSFVSQWMAFGATYGSAGGYVSGRGGTYNQLLNAGAGLRTFKAAGQAPGWVTFNFVAHHHVTRGDVEVDLSAWTSLYPANINVTPKQVGCTVPIVPGPGFCKVFPYTLS